MNYFSQSAFENIRSKVLRLREKAASQRRIIVTTSAFPPDVTLDLAKMLDDFIVKDGRVVLTFKAAKKLGDDWRKIPDNNQVCKELEQRGWLDDTGNLTKYRSAAPPENGKLELCVLVGADQVMDASSLADFYRCDQRNIWQEQMGGSFEPWIRERLNLAHVGYDEKNISNFNTILTALSEQGCADLFQIARFLQALPLEQNGAQDGRTAELMLLRGLRVFNLPSFIGFKFAKKKKLTPYLEAAIRFFRYDLFLEEKTKNKALDAIDLLLKEKAREISENALFTQDERGTFLTDRDFIEAVRIYVQNEDAAVRDKLLDSDFIAVHDKILKFKVKAEPGETKEPPIRKLTGGPVEVVLTALWQTLRDCCAVFGVPRPEIKSIAIYSEKFRHDNEGLSGGGPLTAAELEINAKEYLRKLVGGVDQYFSENYLDHAAIFGDELINITSQLYHDHIDCSHARTAEPSLTFSVKLAFHEHEQLFIRKYAWRLPETQTYRIAKELIEWAVESIGTKHANPIVLPAFHIPYHEELIRAKDDDEARRALLHAIRDVAADSTNLITKEWKEQNDPLLTYLSDLAIAYRKFIGAAKTDGLHSVFHKGNDGQPAAWEVLRKTYESTARAYCGEDKQCQNSPMASMLMRAFLIVASRGKGNNAWVADPFERSGIATVLHPSVLEMLCDQVGYLFACFNYAAAREWKNKSVKKPFHLSKWQDYLDLSTIQMPLGGLIGDENLIVDTQVRGQELIHCIGSPASEEAALSTRLLLRYEGFDDEDIADAEMFAETRESRLLSNILNDYLAIHPHARDGLSIAVYRNTDIQPVISAVHTFLTELAEGDTPLLVENRHRPFAIAITVFTEAGEDVGIARWIEQWKERWEAAETEEKYAAYRHCLFSIAHRVVPTQDSNRKAFARMIRESLDVDIAVLYDFIGAGLRGNEFQRVDTYDVRERTLKFPIIEKSFCTVDDPLLRLRRARVISNPQFRLSSLHLETMARLKSSNTPSGQEHVLIGYGDFAPWQEVVDELHKHVEWVVCIDPSIDDKLIKLRRDNPSEEREIIGFGSGVGLHGELNFTISTEHFRLTDIRFRMERAISTLYPGWEDNTLTGVAESVIREARTLSGLSLVRATGVGMYLHDFLAYALTSKLLSSDEDLLCNHLISLDAYRHWFTKDDMRPDLLWMTANIDKDGRILLNMRLIECKMALQNNVYVEKASQQIKNGFDTLIPAFMPRSPKGGDDSRPDQRYWWLQLHRLIASKAGISRQRQEAVMAAMERLADGDFIITWQGSVLAFWTDSVGGNIEHIGNGAYDEANIGSIQFGIYSMGRNAVHELCMSGKRLKLEWPNEAIQFGGDSQCTQEMKDAKTDDESKIFKATSTQEEKPTMTPLSPKYDQTSKEMTPAEISRHIPERILLGKTALGGRDVFWEFGHRELANRHLLVFGTSGMGKTYAIQCLLCEMGLQQQNVLVMDYTNGFLPNQLEEETKRILAPDQHIVRQSPLPVSPFKLQVQEVGGGFEIPETLVSGAKRIAGTFSQVYETMGDQQYSLLLDALMDLIEQQGNASTLAGLMDVLDSFINDGQHDKSKVLTTISKLKPFVLEKPFADQADGLDWLGIFSDSEHRCHVFQFAGMDALSARLVIEFTLWDLNAFVRGTGNKNLPKVVVLDEAQNLDLSEQSPVAKYLTEGRKFGLSLILATQTMKNLQGDKLNRLFQAGHKLFFRPADTELQEHAKLMVQSVGGTQQEWITNLSSLTKGQCYSLGPSLNTATGKLETKAFKVQITSLGERFGHI